MANLAERKAGCLKLVLNISERNGYFFLQVPVTSLEVLLAFKMK
ncbi:hypothetical protein P609_14260 [Comamonas thiooxydans]|nr:hypothetical protein P609_14260 [Comamonas thiooxydans]